MQRLGREHLKSLEEYSANRNTMRSDVMAHKANRKVALGEHITLLFEDFTTIQYQVQEMLRIEKIFEAAGIQEELDAYNPLIPDGSNLKATCLIEYEDVEERKVWLGKLIGVELKIWIQVAGFDKVYAIADEDMERDTEEKTSAVHFMRYEFTPEMVAAAKSGAAMKSGVDHENYQVVVDPLPRAIRDSLVGDFD